MTSLNKERSTLNFCQEYIPFLEAEGLLHKERGLKKTEGFTTFSAIVNGPDGPDGPVGPKVCSCGKELHTNVIKYGNPIPKVGKAQIAGIIDIAKKISKIEEIKDEREYFFLVCNSDSCYQKYIRDQIFILGYYENNTFIFSHDDPQLRKDGTLEDLIEEPGDAWEIFKENGSVVVQRDGRPITYVQKGSYYHYIIGTLKRYREIISNDFGIKPTDLQAFLLFLVDQESCEDFIEKVGNEDKKKAFDEIKKNFSYFKNSLSKHVLDKGSKLTIEFKEGLDEKTLKFCKFKLDLPEKWKKFFGEFIRCYNTDKHKDVDDIMRKLVKTKKSLILLTTICSKFDEKYHALIKK